MTLRGNPGWTRWGDPPPVNPLTWLRHFYGQDGINCALWAIPGQARFMGGKMEMGRERRTPAAAARKSGIGGFVVGSADAIPRLELGRGTLGVCCRKVLEGRLFPAWRGWPGVGLGGLGGRRDRGPVAVGGDGLLADPLQRFAGRHVDVAVRGQGLEGPRCDPLQFWNREPGL